MATPDPVAPPPPPLPAPPPSSAKKWLLGCLVALLLLVLLGIAVLLLGVYAAKKQIDAIAPDAKRVYEDAQRAASALQSGAQVAPTLSQSAEARMRLMRVAGAVDAGADPHVEPCPSDPARANLTVDAPWMAELATGLPTQPLGTPWLRDPVFATAAAVPLGGHSSEDAQVQALISLDRALGDAGAISVIHTTRLEGNRFEGFVQVIGYPDGGTICVAPIEASGTDQGDLEQRFRAAEEAAVGK